MSEWGAFGLGMMYLIFVVTLHAPRVLAAPTNADEWSSALIALGMCGASWICASAFAAKRFYRLPSSVWSEHST